MEPGGKPTGWRFGHNAPALIAMRCGKSRPARKPHRRVGALTNFGRLIASERCIVGHVSLCQLLANACMAVSRVVPYPCVGVRSS